MSTPRVFTADGSDLGSMGIVQLLLKLGDKEVVQDFVVCRQLKRDVILGADFGKQNCAGIEWTTRRTRVLSLNGIPAVEVEENELGLPVTAAFHVKVPPRHNGVFQVNIHGDTNGTHIISANSIDIVSSQLYVCHILVSKKCQLQAGTIHPRPLA